MGYQNGAAGQWQVVTRIACMTAEFVDGRRRRRNVYHKNSQRYAQRQQNSI